MDVETVRVVLPPLLAKPAPSHSSERSNAITHRFFDFWLLGGASIVIWCVMLVGQYFRGGSEPIENRYMQLTATFSLLSLVCNYPHFLISYRFGYGRGARFILKHAFTLIAVPLGLIGLYGLAFWGWKTDLSESSWIHALNRGFALLSLEFRLGTTANNMGMEIMGLTAWLMYVTVGWHYSKQVFGCMMVYSKYDAYPISKQQRTFLKGSLLSLALFNFVYVSNWASTTPMYFQSVPLSPIGLSPAFYVLAWAGVLFFGAAVLYGVCWRNYRQFGKAPSPNFLIAWIAYHLWVPLYPQKEFYLLVVPFFHSLQYLPFAYRLELRKIARNQWFYVQVSARLLALFLIGYFVFEGIPAALDSHLQTSAYQTAWFFVIAFAIFINIHHFFIDSVVWRLDQTEVKASLFTANPTAPGAR